MAIKDILVHVIDSDAGASRVRTAVALASAHEAHLTGLYTLWIPPMPTYVEVRVGEELMQRQRELYLDRARKAEAFFNQCADAAGVRTQWRRVEDDRARELALHARYCDLMITGRLVNGNSEYSVRLAESIILTTAKPVIVMPDVPNPPQPGKHIMVGWNGSRESSRAVDAALPLLAAAERVDVVCVDPQGDDHGAVPGADLCTHLARHGVRAHAQSVDSGGHGAGETLLGRAAADGADLLVMGAYGHSRWREVVLGGATAHVLANSRIAVLMAH